MSEIKIAGGCQCGAVRYELTAKPIGEFCHCRMCQRATGGVFAALSTVKKSDLSWTRGEPTYYASSNVARRGFCGACGTPLVLDCGAAPVIDVTTGSLDDPEGAPLVHHFGVESRVSWLKLCDGLPERTTDSMAGAPPNSPDFRSHQSRIS